MLGIVDGSVQGVTLFEVLAGRPPFLGTAYGELLVQHMTEKPPALSKLVDASVPDALVVLADRMLAKNKNERPTMRQVAAELAQLGGLMSGAYPVAAVGTSGSNTPVGLRAAGNSLPGQPSPSLALAQVTMASLPGLTPTPVPGSSTLGSSAGQAQPAASRRSLAVAIGSVVGAVAVGLVLVMTLRPSPPPVVQLPPPRPPVVEKKPVESPPPRAVQVQVSSTPLGASVVRVRDGQLLGITPLTLKNQAAAGSEQLRVVLPGYAEEVLTIDLDKDFEQQLELRRRNTRTPIGKRGKPKYTKGDLTVVD